MLSVKQILSIFVVFVLLINNILSENNASPDVLTGLEDLPSCEIKNGNLNSCLKNVIQTLASRLRNGSKELNLPAFDPFVLNRTTFQYTNGAVSGRITMRTGKIYGFADAEIKSIDMKVDKDHVEFEEHVYLPTLHIVGNYKADVKINNVALKPKGNYNITLMDVNIKEFGEGELYNKDNHRYLRLSKLDAEPQIGELQIQANGIFPDPSLDEIFLNVTNQYWREIYSIMLPETRHYWAPMLLRVVNEAFSVIPFDRFVN